jgi:hypothetical protein
MDGGGAVFTFVELDDIKQHSSMHEAARYELHCPLPEERPVSELKPIYGRLITLRTMKQRIASLRKKAKGD